MRLTAALFSIMCAAAFLPVHGHAAGHHAYGAETQPAKGLIKISQKSDTGQGAQNFIEKMGSNAVSFLADDSLSQSQKEAKFKKLLKSSFDLKTIGRFALGRYWRTATSAQKKEYQKLFEAMVVNVYAARFQEYDGQQLKIKSFRQDSPKDILVQSVIVPQSGPDVKVDWRVRYKNGRYTIIDVIIEGVSMALTQRSDFSSVIQRGGGDIQALIDHLKKQS